MSKRQKPATQGVLNDPAERWLRENDPLYAQTKRSWHAPSTDALSKARSESNEIHPSLEDLHESTPKGEGAYRQLPRIADDVETTISSDEEPE